MTSIPLVERRFCRWCNAPREPGVTMENMRHEQECRGRVLATLRDYAATMQAPPEAQQWIKLELERAQEWGD